MSTHTFVHLRHSIRGNASSGCLTFFRVTDTSHPTSESLVRMTTFAYTGQAPVIRREITTAGHSFPDSPTAPFQTILDTRIPFKSVLTSPRRYMHLASRTKPRYTPWTWRECGAKGPMTARTVSRLTPTPVWEPDDLFRVPFRLETSRVANCDRNAYRVDISLTQKGRT